MKWPEGKILKYLKLELKRGAVAEKTNKQTNGAVAEKTNKQTKTQTKVDFLLFNATTNTP